jgi:hypothetical protein
MPIGATEHAKVNNRSWSEDERMLEHDLYPHGATARPPKSPAAM